MAEEHRDALAKVIDPDAWQLIETPLFKQKAERHVNDVLRPSREIADRIIESGLMVSMEWDNREYLSAKRRIIERTSQRGKCYSVEDGLDGYYMHDPRCPHWPDGAIGGTTCIS
jgi:hypothetical protein